MVRPWVRVGLRAGRSTHSNWGLYLDCFREVQLFLLASSRCLLIYSYQRPETLNCVELEQGELDWVSLSRAEFLFVGFLFAPYWTICISVLNRWVALLALGCVGCVEMIRVFFKLVRDLLARAITICELETTRCVSGWVGVKSTLVWEERQIRNHEQYL